MNCTEFYITPKGDIMIHCQDGIRQLQSSDRSFVSAMICMLQNLYPAALSALSKKYEPKKANPANFEFFMVRRFIKCNWGEYDSILDIDQFGNFNFEQVRCPMRGECDCERKICNPEFNSKLTDREIEIMHLFYQNFSTEDIADKLCISCETVRTHRRNAFRRVKVHSLPEFFIYARQNNLFQN